MSCFDYEEVTCTRCKEKFADGYNVIQGKIVCDQCLRKDECRHCGSTMYLEETVYCCDECGATHDTEQDWIWTQPVKELT